MNANTDNNTTFLSPADAQNAAQLALTMAKASVSEEGLDFLRIINVVKTWDDNKLSLLIGFVVDSLTTYRTLQMRLWLHAYSSAEEKEKIEKGFESFEKILLNMGFSKEDLGGRLDLK